MASDGSGDEGTQCPRCDSWTTQAVWVDGRCFHFQCLDCGHLKPNGGGDLTRGVVN